MTHVSKRSQGCLLYGCHDLDFFSSEEMRRLMVDPIWVDHITFCCSYQDRCASRARFVGNVAELEELTSDCWHLHDEEGAHPAHIRNAWPRSAKSAHLAPPVLAFAVAVAASWWVARVKGYPMPIVSMPAGVRRGSPRGVDWEARMCYPNGAHPPQGGHTTRPSTPCTTQGG